MDYKQSCSQIISDYSRKYKLTAPDSDSVALTKELWQEWEKSGTTPPDINTIARDYAKHENGFFYELVSITEKMESRKLDIHLCQFTLDEYNAYAVTAKDGFIVLVDDVFFQVLFFLSCILVFDSMEVIASTTEREQVRQFVTRIVNVNYFNRQRIDFGNETIVHELMKRDYEMTEFANYLFNSFKAFIISHEIGHHVLHHAKGTINRVFAANNVEVDIEIDERSIECEFEADEYGYKLFHVLSNTTDDSVYYAWCKYKLYFAPVLLFDLFNGLDRLKEKRENKTIVYTTHPHPTTRIKTLYDRYDIDRADPMYRELKASLDYYLR